MLMRTVLTFPSSPLKTVAMRVPLPVWMENSSPLTIPKSLAYLARHLIPLPHISASEPSALMILMVMSQPSSPGRRYRTPSAPTPKWRSQTFTHHGTSISSFSVIPSTRTKSFPHPWYFQNLITGASWV